MREGLEGVLGVNSGVWVLERGRGGSAWHMGYVVAEKMMTILPFPICVGMLSGLTGFDVWSRRSSHVRSPTDMFS